MPKLNLNTKDIALLTNRSVGTIDNARSWIRKKMGLDNEANLTTFLLSLRGFYLTLFPFSFLIITL